MIYANWLGLAVLSSALTQSEGESLKSHKEAALESRELGQSNSNINQIPAKTCLTESQCNQQRKKMGFEDHYYYVNTYHHHGCFYKNDKAYWGSGGTAAQKAYSDLPGIQVRIWCDDTWGDDGHKSDSGWKGDGTDEPTPSPTRKQTLAPTKSPAWKDDGWKSDEWKPDGWEKDGWDDDGHKKTDEPTLSPTEEPTDSPFGWNGDDWADDGWEKDGWEDNGWKSDCMSNDGLIDGCNDICLSLNDCNMQRKKMEIKVFEVGNYNTHGCFSKNGKAYWGKDGSEEEMAKSSLSGSRQRIYCKSHNEWDNDAWDNDGWEDDGHKPTLSPTRSPIKKDNGWEKDGWEDDGWNKDGWETDGHDPTSSPTLYPTTLSPVWKSDGWGKDGWDDDAWGGDSHKPSTPEPTTKPTTKEPTKPSTPEPTTKPTTKEPTKPSTPEPTTKPTTKEPSKPTTDEPTKSCDPDVIIKDDYFQLNQDVTKNLPVLQNDTPTPGGSLFVCEASAVTLAPQSTRLLQSEGVGYECRPSNNGMKVKFIPDEGFSGIAVCTYKACDGNCSGTATIYIKVVPEGPTKTPTKMPTPRTSTTTSSTTSTTTKEEPTTSTSTTSSTTTTTTKEEPTTSTSTTSSTTTSTTQTKKPTQSPTVSTEPSISSQPSGNPSNSNAPSISSQPSSEPSVSTEPSSQPSSHPSSLPSISIQPSVSLIPSSQPSVSIQPSTSLQPSSTPSVSWQPSGPSDQCTIDSSGGSNCSDDKKKICCVQGSDVDNKVCRNNGNSCQPGPASWNACAEAKPSAICLGAQVCCKVINGNKSNFECVATAADCLN